MKVTELRSWNELTPKEQERLRKVYNVDKNDNLPDSITKTMANPAPEGEEGGENA